MEKEELVQERDAAAVMKHHVESLKDCDMKTVISDYDEHLIAIVNMDGNHQVDLRRRRFKEATGNRT